MDKTHKVKTYQTNPSIVGGGGFAVSKTAIVSLVKVESTLKKGKSNIFLDEILLSYWHKRAKSDTAKSLFFPKTMTFKNHIKYK